LLLSIIIVNYNVKYFLEQCLLSVSKAVRNIDAEIFVIDNASADGSFEFFQNRFSNVHFIWNKTNVGFAKANNQVLKIAQGKYILFLNPDTIIPEDCFEKCIDFIKKNNGALGIKMIDGHGNFLKESKRGFPSPFTSFFKLAGFSKLFPGSKTFSKYHLGNLNENENHEVDVLAGAFMMMPKHILNKTGGFDEDFFMYGEDIDLSFRIQKAGFKNYYFAESSIIHFKGESTKKGSLNYVKMFYKAMSVFVKKHYGSKQAGLFSFFIHIAIFSRAALAAGSRLLKRFTSKVNPQKKRVTPGQTNLILIAGSEDEFENVKKLASEPLAKNKLFQRIETDNVIEEIEEISTSKNVEGAILCEGKLSFKKIIESLPRLPKNIDLKIFSAGSHSIIGGNV
jgi:GT2 family glycosyltransferase